MESSGAKKIATSEEFKILMAVESVSVIIEDMVKFSIEFDEEAEGELEKALSAALVKVELGHKSRIFSCLLSFRLTERFPKNCRTS